MARIEPHTKSWLCQQYNISNSTLQRWLNNPLFQPKLIAAHYDRFQKKLTPEQIKVFQEHFGMP